VSCCRLATAKEASMRMTSSAAGPWLYFALGCAATVTAMQLLSMGDGVRGLSTAKTTLGREKTRGEKAFILAVELRFRDTGSAQVGGRFARPHVLCMSSQYTCMYIQTCKYIYVLINLLT